MFHPILGCLESNVSFLKDKTEYFQDDLIYSIIQAHFSEVINAKSGYSTTIFLCKNCYFYYYELYCSIFINFVHMDSVPQIRV